MNELDILGLQNVLYPKTQKVPYDPQMFRKVAFDVFELTQSPVESLWVLEKDKDGKEYLIATYDSQSLENSLSNWSTVTDVKKESVTLLYKNYPICKFASAEFGFTKDDVQLFEKMLIEKATNEKEFVYRVVDSVSDFQKDTIKQKFPELK